VAFLHAVSAGKQTGVWHDAAAGISAEAQTAYTAPVAMPENALAAIQLLS